MALTKVANRMISGAAFQVLDYGAVGDGVTDDTAAIQAAITAARDAGGHAGWICTTAGTSGTWKTFGDITA